MSAKSSLCGAAGCGLRFLGRIILGSCSDHGRIGRALEMTFHLFFSQFLSDVGWSFCVAGAVFGEVGR